MSQLKSLMMYLKKEYVKVEVMKSRKTEKGITEAKVDHGHLDPSAQGRNALPG